MTSIAIIEDQKETREGLRALLSEAGYCCTGVYRTMEDALEEIRRRPPSVVLADIGLPGMSGIDGIPEIRRTSPGCAILILTVFEDDERIFRALCAGASGYLLKTTSPERLIQSIDDVLAGGAPISPEVARRVLQIFREFRPPESAAHSLSPHELRLLQMIVDGHNYQSASLELGVTVHTVSFHMRKVYSKLEVHTKAEAVAKALRLGLVRWR